MGIGIFNIDTQKPWDSAMIGLRGAAQTTGLMTQNTKKKTSEDMDFWDKSLMGVATYKLLDSTFSGEDDDGLGGIFSGIVKTAGSLFGL